MKLYVLNNASRELARWRELLRPPGDRSARRQLAGSSLEFPVTQWPITEWSETLPASAVWSVEDEALPGASPQ